MNIKTINNKYIKGYQDEWSRPTLFERDENKKGNYRNENPHYLCAFYYCLLLDISPEDAKKFQQYYNSELLQMCQGRVINTWSRQPLGENWYPKKHSNFKESVWNRISRDEIVGVFAVGDDETRMILRTVCEANMPMDDFGTYDTRYCLDLKTRYYCIKGMGGRPSILMSAMWHIDKLYDIFQVKVLRHFARKKSIADTVIKNFIRASAGVGERPSKELLSWAVNTFLEDENHPFRKMINERT